MTDFLAGDRGLTLDGAYGHPLRTLFSRHRPRTVKEAFYWAEILAQRSPHVYAVVRKFGEFPITTLRFDEVGAAEKAAHVELHGDHLKTRAFLGEMSFDSWIYGNALCSLNEPFTRLLDCPGCQRPTNVTAVDHTFSLDKLTWRYGCPGCRRVAVSAARDIPLLDPKRLNLIRWDPKHIDIKHNRYTRESVYYYSIPGDDVNDVRAGDKHLIDTTPMGLLRAMQKRQLLKFGPGNIYHMKQPGPSGLQGEWGLPPVTAAIEMFLFAAALRKANEAIALEHVTPFRVFYPQSAGSTGDPIMSLNLADFTDRLETAYREFRRDPNKILVAPVPLGVNDIGGQGRALLTLSELELAEKNIIKAFGVPPEFLDGGLGQMRGDPTLRMIENQLQHHVDDLNGLLRWISLKTSTFLGTAPVKVRLADFKMTDDLERRQLLLQLWGQGKVSDTTIYELFEVDGEHERKQRHVDTLADLREQLKLEHEGNKLKDSLSQKAMASAQAAGGPTDFNNQPQVLDQAAAMAQEFTQMEPGLRQSKLDDMMTTSPLMALAIKYQISQAEQAEAAQAKAQTSGGGDAGGAA